MSEQFTRDHLRIAVGKILHTLGWHNSNSTPLEYLTDLLRNYISQLSRVTCEYANEFGYADPNLDHLALAFRELRISVPELEEFVKYVNFGAPATQVCKYPVPKEDQLNFLKPGSKEVVTRPVHIHEHLPPMNPILEGAIVEKEATTPPVPEKVDDAAAIPENPSVFKKPPDVLPGEFKRSKKEDEGSRPTREISSVMMTTSGFLSPAREGRLPEAKTPVPPPVEQPSQPTSSFGNLSNSDHNMGVLPMKKLPRPMKKIDRRKDRIGKELFKNQEDKIRKNPLKDSLKMKQLKKFSNDMSIMADFPQFLNMGKLPQAHTNQKLNPAKFNNKALQAARMKTEKFNTTITPLPMKSQNNRATACVDKLHTVPDRKKVNILKKISNVKDKVEEKIPVKKEEKEDPSSPPNLIIDEPDDIIPKLKQFRSDITIEPINPTTCNSVAVKPELMYLDESPPGTPSTPKTPEMIATPQSVIKEKKKRKPKVPKLAKMEPLSGNYGSCNGAEALADGPKTPKAEINVPTHRESPVPQQMPEFPFGNINPYQFGRPNLNFLANFGGPGLIPQPIGNPMNPLSNPLFPGHFPLLNLPDFGQNPYLPPQNVQTHPNNLSNFVPKVEELPSSSSSVPEPASLPAPPPRTPELVTSSVKTEKLDKKSKEHKKEKKDKLKKKMKKEKLKAEKKEEKKKFKKKEKRDKRKEKEIKEEPSAVPKLTLKLKSPSPRPVTPDTTTKKLNIKPVVKTEPELLDDEQLDVEGPHFARISALVTGPPKLKNTPPPTPPRSCVVPPAVETVYPNSYAIPKKKHKPEIKPIKLKVDIKKEPVIEPPTAPPSKYIDAQGNEVWICPACSRQDDGSPMIGCDGCDAWYHWVCVGIQVPPDENENWYCRHCLLRKDEDLQTDKKKKRKRKDKKDHQ